MAFTTLIILLITMKLGISQLHSYSSHLNRNNARESANVDADIPRYTFDKTKIDEFIQTIIDCHDIIGTGLAIVQLDENDTLVDQYTQGYGIMDATNIDSAKVTNKSQFCIGSATKQFTAATLGKHLISRGKNFDTRLIDLLGEDGRFFEKAGYGGLPTIRDILSHRMAIPRYDSAWSMGVEEKREDVWRHLHLLSKDYDEKYLAKMYRSSALYNNWMVSLGGYVLENITGKSWEENINSTFFQPLDIDSSFTHESYGSPEIYALPAYRIKNEATQEEVFEKIDPEWFRYTTNYVAPAGTICMSPEDMLKYLTFLVSKKVDEKLEPLKRAVDHIWFEASNPLMLGEIGDFSQPREPYAIIEDIYALCVQRGLYRNFQQISHGGSVYGYNSYMLVFPDLKLGLFLSSSQGLSDIAYAQQLGFGLFDIATGQTDSIFTDNEQGAKRTSTFKPTYAEEVAKGICENYRNSTPLPDRNSPSVEPPPDCKDLRDTTLARLAGDYRHPVFGNLTIRFNESGFEDNYKFKFRFGVFGEAKLCPGRNFENDQFQLYFDNNGPLWFGNEPSEATGLSTVVKFVKDAGGRGVKLVVPLIEKTAPSLESVTFTKIDYEPCQPSLCKNGGKCEPIGDFDYRCECPASVKGDNCEIGPRTDCTDIKKYYPDESKKSGIYQIEIPGFQEDMFNVYCDMETDKGGWTIIHRRTNDTSDDNFHQNSTFDQYRHGFGFPGANYNYWLGLDAIQTLANSDNKNYTLRINLSDCGSKTAYEEYQNFWLGNETSQFTLHLKANSDSGTAGDALTVGNSYVNSNNMPFSTPDKDNSHGCAKTYMSGWWFNNCYDANLNGKYYPNCTSANNDGIAWLPWRSEKYSMRYAAMMIRRADVI